MEYSDPKGIREAVAAAEEKLRQRDIERENQVAALVPLLQVQLESCDFRALVGILRGIQETHCVLQYQERDTHILFLKTPNGRHQFFLMNKTQEPTYLPMSLEQIRALAYVWLEDTGMWEQSPKTIAIAFWRSLEGAIQEAKRVFLERYSPGSCSRDSGKRSRSYIPSHIEKQQQALVYWAFSWLGICTFGVAVGVAVWYGAQYLWGLKL